MKIRVAGSPPADNCHIATVFWTSRWVNHYKQGLNPRQRRQPMMFSEFLAFLLGYRPLPCLSLFIGSVFPVFRACDRMLTPTFPKPSKQRCQSINVQETTRRVDGYRERQGEKMACSAAINDTGSQLYESTCRLRHANVAAFFHRTCTILQLSV